jgi:phage N-6-adenine-methyltransferase
MDSVVLGKLTSRTDAPHADNACWQTPPEVFAKLQNDFGPFDIDLFADEENHLLPRWFGPSDSNMCSGIDDALALRWIDYGFSGYANPPYGRTIGKVLKHAKAMCREGFDTTLLLPLRITKAFREHVMDHGAAQVYFCNKRITFYENGKPRLDSKGVPQAAVFDSIIVRYMHGYHNALPQFDIWRVPPHGRL